MHGRPRLSVRDEAEKQTPQQQEAAKKKVKALRGLQNAVLEAHKACQYSEASLGLCADLLQHNPDASFAWNFRKKAVLGVLQNVQAEQGKAKTKADEGRVDAKAEEGGVEGKAEEGSVEAKVEERKGRASTPVDAPPAEAQQGQKEVSGAQGREGVEEGHWRQRAEAEKKLLLSEMRAVEDALKTNPKAYGAWHHRRWLLLPLFLSSPSPSPSPLPSNSLSASPSESPSPSLTQSLTPSPRASAPGISGCSGGLPAWPGLSKAGKAAAAEVLAREYGLLKKLLTLDDRNFHGWDYRRFVVEVSSATPEQELAFAEEKINDNFSNYSAWHYRSKLLPAAHPRLDLEPGILQGELDLVRQAFFTEPEDQSGWMYFLWLLGQMCPRPPPVLAATWPSPLGAAASPNPVAVSSNHQPLLLTFSEPVAGVGHRTVEVLTGSSGESGGAMGKRGGTEGVAADGGTSEDEWKWTPVGSTGSCARVWAGSRPRESAQSGKSGVSAALQLSIGARRGVVSALGDEFQEAKVLLTLPCLGTEEEGPAGQLGQLPGAEGASENSPQSKGTEPSDALVLRACGGSGAHSDALVSGVSGASGGPGSSSSRGSSGSRRSGTSSAPAPEWRAEALGKEIESCRELLQLEPDCKWVLFTLARLLETQAQVQGTEAEEAAWEIEELYGKLKEVDPFRSGVYEDRLATHRLRKALSSVDSSSSASLTLRGLGLSGLVPAQALAGCTVLDVSHNRFRTMEGFEMLQQVRELNLSHNCIRSAAALQPLSLLPHLLKLDLSHNKMGATPYDTARYLFPSPLTNSKPWKLKSKSSNWDGGEGEKLALRYRLAWDCLRDLWMLSQVRELRLTGNAVEGFGGFQEVIRFLLPACTTVL